MQHNLQFLTFRGHLLDVPFKLAVGILLGVGADSVLYGMYIIANWHNILWVGIPVCVHTCVYVYVCIHVCMCMCAYMCVCVCVHTCMYVYVCIHVCISKPVS